MAGTEKEKMEGGEGKGRERIKTKTKEVRTHVTLRAYCEIKLS